MSDEKKVGRPAKKELPNGYAYYEKTKLEIVGYKENKPQLKELKKMKTVMISEEQARELNMHKYNTLIEYVKK